MYRITILISSFIVSLGLLPPAVYSQESASFEGWPQWRGPDRSGTWYNGPSVDTLTTDRIQKIWDVPISSGYSGPTVSGGLVYVMDYLDGNERVLCFNASDGVLVWSYAYPVMYSVGYPTGPRASVLISGQRAYTWGTMGHLNCLDAFSGKVHWKIDTEKQYQSRIPTWGMASNPILAGDHLIVQVGGRNGACMVAFQKETGQEVWRALEDEPSYVAPVRINQAGEDVLVCWTGASVTGLNPVNGKIHWILPITPLRMVMNIADPVYDAPYLFLSAFFDGSYLVKLGQDTLSAELVYHRHGTSESNTDALHCCMSTPFIQDGLVYGIGSYGEARCLDLGTGLRLWEDLSLVQRERWANVHLVKQEDKVWGFNETGELLLGKFSRDRYQDLGRVRVIDPVKISPNPRNGITWAHPAFAGNMIYFRSDSRLVCVSVK